MTTPSPTVPMPVEQSARLADFARTCKAAARAVSLYPGAHPAIASSLSRLVASTARLTEDGPVSFLIGRDTLSIDGKTPNRPDPSIGELASLLHERLIGLLTIRGEADAEDWRTLLLLLARAPEDLRADGGIASSWTRSGRSHFDIQEIDYAEVLRERGGDAAWDGLVRYCLQGDADVLDERALAALLEALEDPDRFAQLLERVQNEVPGTDGASMAARVAALLRLMHTAIEAARKQGESQAERAMQTIAASCATLTPETMIALLERRQSSHAHEAATATMVAERMTDEAVASFMARSVVAERGATARLAHALEALTPSPDRKQRIVQLAHDEVAETELGKQDGFEQLWEDVDRMVTSYSDEEFVSRQYGRELSAARAQAIEVERTSDDPPERVQSWLATVSDGAVQQLDLQMVLDLLRIETTPQWEPMAGIAASEVERRTQAGDAAGALALVEAIAGETKPDGRAPLKQEAGRIIERLCGGPLARHVAQQLRTIDDGQLEAYNRLCQALGPGVVRALADALAREDNNRAIGRLGRLLLGFGAAGRRSVEQLKNAANPAVRRTAIMLLRSAGGQEALTDLASMLGDADPEVQRESIRAIVEIGSISAYATVHRLLLEADTPRDTALRELLGLRDEKAVPLFCYVLTRGEPRGKLVAIHASMIDALGGMKPRPESVRTLDAVLKRGRWWAPFRTSALRQAAATALRRLGTPEARAALEAAASTGSRGVRRAARAQVALLPRTEKERA